jgi:hypothetical protein
MKRIIELLLNSYLLPLWGTLIILLVFPVKIDRYKTAIVEQGEFLNDNILYYVDLDNDGNSERVNLFHNGLGIAAVTIYNMHGILDQWTLKGRFDFVMNTGMLITGDSNHDGIKEIYVFTLSNDSVLLHIISDYRMKTTNPESIFVSAVSKKGEKADPFIVEASMDDLNNDGTAELIFGISSGYSIFPRNIFAYNLVRDTFTVSPLSGYFFHRILQEDINEDGLKEIIPEGNAASNVHDPAIPFPDTNSWLMILDHDLRFVFDPVLFPGMYSSLKLADINDEMQKPLLAALYAPPMNSGDSNLLIVFDSSGHKIRSHVLNNNAKAISSLTQQDGSKVLVVGTNGEGISIYNYLLQPVKTIRFNYNGFVTCIDIDLDGAEEILNPDLLARKVIIYRNDLEHPVECSVEGQSEKGLIYSVNSVKGKSPELYLQLGSEYKLYSYTVNRLYQFRWLLYTGIYLCIFLFTQIARKIQLEQIRRKGEIQKKITDLQLQIVRNQLDPHFIMNAINSIIAGIRESNKEELRDQLMRFSLLHRSLVLTSDRIKRSLTEEIEFTKNYLALEKFRFGDKFDYDIKVDPSIDTEKEVPKMIIQIFTENAIKHGIFHLEKKGQLNIKIFTSEGKLQFEITDNGVGRKFIQGIETGSTHRGTYLMEEYIKLLNQIYNDKVHIITDDLYDSSGLAAGTSVRISVS